MDTETLIPPPTVQEAMAFGGLAAAHLVAGRAGLNRPIEGVRMLDAGERRPSDRRRELLLVSAQSLLDGDLGPAGDLILGMAGADVAGLVVKVKPEDELPARLLSQADQHGLPLLTLPAQIPWSELMEPILERTIHAEHSRLKRSLEIHRRFTELVLDGKGLSEICRTLAQLLNSAVSIEDASLHLLAHAGGDRRDPLRRKTIAGQGTPSHVRFDPQIQRMLRQVEAHRAPTKVPAFPHVGMRKERIIAPILAANQVLGYISLLDQQPDNEELAFMAMEQAALVVALALIKEREVAEVEARVRGDYLDDLIHGTYGDEAAAERRARHLSYHLSGKHILLIADIDDFRGFIRASQVGEDAIQAVKRELLRRVSAVVHGAFPHALIAARSDSVLALFPVEEESGFERPLEALGAKLQQAIAEWRPGFTLSVGYSAPVALPEGVSIAHREVQGVLDVLARFERRAQVVTVPNLGLTGLLAGVSDDRLAAFADRHLGELAAHDRTRQGPLLETLRSYLETGEQQAAARRLKVHANTLRYRLDRIREITGADLDDPETRLNLAVALRIHRLLGF